MVQTWSHKDNNLAYQQANYQLSTSSYIINSRINVNKKIRKATDRLIKNNVIKVHIKDDKQNKVLHIEDIEIKDKKKFEEEMDKLSK